MKFLAASLGVVCACGGGLGADPSGRAGDLPDAAGTIAVDAGSPGSEPIVGTWEGTTTIGSATTATFDTAFVHAGALYWIGDGIQSMPTTGGAVTTIATPSERPESGLTSDARGFAYVDSTGSIGVVPWTGNATLIPPIGSDSWTGDVVVGNSLYATTLAGTSLLRMPRTGGTAVEVAGPSTGDGCTIRPIMADNNVTRLIADSQNVYFQGIYAWLEGQDQQPVPGCRVQPDDDSFNWYFGAVPIASGQTPSGVSLAPFVTAFRGILTGASDRDPGLVGTSNNLTTNDQAPAYSTVASGATTELVTTSPMSGVVGGTDVQEHDGIVYWTESAWGSEAPQLFGAMVRCMSLADPTRTPKTISSGEGTANGMVIADQVYFQVCDGLCDSGQAQWRAAPLCE